jgi:hypothetical protein
MALLVGTTKQASPMIAMLLLALVAVAAADGTAHGGHGHAPLTGLTQCVTSCGTDVTACFLECYKPPVSSAASNATSRGAANLPPQLHQQRHDLHQQTIGCNLFLLSKCMKCYLHNHIT